MKRKAETVLKTKKQEKISKKNNCLELKLISSARYANQTCVTGTTNKPWDIEKTNGWNLVQQFHHHKGKYQKNEEIPFSLVDVLPNKKYSFALEKKNVPGSGFFYAKSDWYFHIDPLTSIYQEKIELIPQLANFHPIADPGFNLSKNNKCLLKDVIWLNKMRFGNCTDRSILVAAWLWKHSEGIHRIEIMQMPFNHACVFVNRSDECPQDFWVIDPWLGEDGLIYHGTELTKKLSMIEAYCEHQENEKKRIEPEESSTGNEAREWKVLWNIEPAKDKYPSYSPFMSIEDYYSLKNIYPADIVPDLEKLHENHRNDFNPVLSELKNLFANDLNTNLLFAVSIGNRKGVEYYLAMGANVNFQNKVGFSALMLASQYKRTHIADLLVKQGAKVELISDENYTALGLAVCAGSMEIATLLLKNGADAGVCIDENTLYDIAIEAENTEMAELLEFYNNIQANKNLTKIHKNRFFASESCWEVGERFPSCKSF